jgi:hypothetical protein
MKGFNFTTKLETDLRQGAKSKCQHKLVRKGYYLGLEIDKHFCVRCGAVLDSPEWPLGDQPSDR